MRPSFTSQFSSLCLSVYILVCAYRHALVARFLCQVSESYSMVAHENHDISPNGYQSSDAGVAQYADPKEENLYAALEAQGNALTIFQQVFGHKSVAAASCAYRMSQIYLKLR